MIFLGEYTPVSIMNETSTILDCFLPGKMCGFDNQLCLAEGTLNFQGRSCDHRAAAKRDFSCTVAGNVGCTYYGSGCRAVVQAGWMYGLLFMGVSKNRGYPQIIHLNRVFHHKPSILGYPYFWKHPYVFTIICLTCIPYTVYPSK